MIPLFTKREAFRPSSQDADAPARRLRHREPGNRRVRHASAKIISMSFSAPIPAELGFLALPLDLTSIVRSQNLLLVAVAGNGYTDVDEEDREPTRSALRRTCRSVE